jgi:hypothetical protein
MTNLLKGNNGNGAGTTGSNDVETLLREAQNFLKKAEVDVEGKLPLGEYTGVFQGIRTAVRFNTVFIDVMFDVGGNRYYKPHRYNPERMTSFLITLSQLGTQLGIAGTITDVESVFSAHIGKQIDIQVVPYTREDGTTGTGIEFQKRDVIEHTAEMETAESKLDI